MLIQEIFFIIYGFAPKRFTRQKKFKRDNKWKPIYKGEKNISEK